MKASHLWNQNNDLQLKHDCLQVPAVPKRKPSKSGKKRAGSRIEVHQIRRQRCTLLLQQIRGTCAGLDDGDDDAVKITKAQLKVRCKNLKLHVSGSKDDLLARLAKHGVFLLVVSCMFGVYCFRVWLYVFLLLFFYSMFFVSSRLFFTFVMLVFYYRVLSLRDLLACIYACIYV